jgi:hypothetical protein
MSDDPAVTVPAMPITSIATFKRALAVGTVVHVDNHIYPSLTGTRTVLTAQTSKLQLSFPAGHDKFGSTSGSWLDFPQRQNILFNGSSVTILEDDGQPFCTITFPQD